MLVVYELDLNTKYWNVPDLNMYADLSLNGSVLSSILQNHAPFIKKLSEYFEFFHFISE